jgi:hypothetical protein
MIAYCNNDIVLLEKIYFKLRGWHQTHLDLRPLLLFESVCPTCQSTQWVQFLPPPPAFFAITKSAAPIGRSLSNYRSEPTRSSR